MKKSTLLLIVAAAFFVASLAHYDLQLRAQVLKGDYARPFYGYDSLDLRGFDRIELRSSTVTNIQVEQGDYKVLQNPRGFFVSVRVEDSTLVIEGHFPDHYQGSNGSPVLYVSCPQLRSLKTDAWYMVGQDTFTDRTAVDLRFLPTVIRGFHEDSLSLLENNASNVQLEGNRLKRFSARLGGGGPALTIGEGNRIDSSELLILAKGQLLLQGTDIGKLDYRLGDSASLTVNGVTARYLKPN